MVYDIGFGGNPTCKFLWVEPNGTRHYLGSGAYNGVGYALGGPYETADGSHIVYSGNGRDGGTISYPDGTSVSITLVNNRLLPTTISDRNGNYIQIAYKPDCFQVGNEMFCGYFSPIALDYVTDTLSRLIQFQYDSSYRLISITTPGFGGTSQNPVTNTLVQFDYQTVAPTYSFTGLTVERGASSFRLKHIYFPATGTGYLPTYTQYAVVTSMSMRRQMTASTWPPGSPPSITDGVESASITFNYPASGSLTDCPSFTQRTDTAVNSPVGVYSYSTSTDTIAQEMTFTITQPDSTTVLLTRSTNASLPANGRLVQTEVKYGAASMAKVKLSYGNDGGGSPQVQSVTSYDDTATPIKVDRDYDAKGNITNKREYGYQVNGVWQVRRRTRTTYTTIAAAVNLATEVDVYDALLNTNDADDVMIAKATYAYDNYVSMGGMENYGGTANPPGHLSWFDSSNTARGNVTGVTQWTDLTAGTTIQHLAKYDIFGNVVKAQVSCCLEKDLTNTQDTYWSQTDTETSGDPNGVHQTTSTDYDFNTSLPVSATDAGGLVTNISYNAALNPSSVTLPTGAIASAGYNYANLSSTKTVTFSDMGMNGGTYGPVTRTLTTTTNYDGWGRVIQTVDPNNAQVNTSYDVMGRVVSRTNPFAAGGTPGPATTFQYDLANKAVITTLPGGNTVRSDYTGATVTATDQVNRKTKRESDGLGRLIKVTEKDVSTGTLTQETGYSYNLRDELTQVNQGGQYRSYKYDALGRLLFEKIPEQTPTIPDGGISNQWTTAYAYTEFGSVNKKTDARGVETHYAFDALHRVTQTWYTGVGGNDSGSVRPTVPSSVATTGDVVVGYTSWGAISNVNIFNANGVGYAYTESYIFDGSHQPTSVTRYMLDPASDTRKTYTTRYEHNGGSQLLKMIYPSGQQVSVNHDDKGRLLSLTYNPEDTIGYLTGVTYNIEARMTGGTLGNGVVQTYGFDTNRSQLVSQTATKGGTQLMNLTYDYQATAGQSGVGSTVGNSHQLISLSGTINGTTESASYTYDLLKRLVTSNQTTNGTSAQRHFAYDRWGNRTTVWDTTSGGNQLQAVTLEQSGGAPTNRIQSVVPRTNAALAASGATATASSTVNGSWPASAVINGDRKGVNAYNGGVWADATSQTYPDWIEVDFSGSKSINEIDVFTIQDNVTNPSEPTEQMTFGAYGITDYQVQYWNGSSWQTVTGGSVTNNNKVWRKFSFTNITTSKIRVYVTHAPELYSYVTEIEAYQSVGSGTTYTYDSAGNVTNDGAHSYLYDAANRLVSVDSGSTAQYKYDYQNRRVTKIVGSSWTHYVWEGSQVISEHDATTAYTTSPPYQEKSARIDYVYARGRMINTRERTSSTGAWTTRYYVSDLWGTRLVLDTSGNVVGRQGHLPFGEEFGESGTQEKHHFTTYESESESSTDYAVNRQYSQGEGRFGSADPYQASSYLVNPQSWNRYSYVLNDPIHNVDPLGLLESVPAEVEADPCSSVPETGVRTLRRGLLVSLQALMTTNSKRLLGLKVKPKTFWWAALMASTLTMTAKRTLAQGCLVEEELLM